MSLANLPEDVVLLIWQHCTLDSISALSTVNRAFYAISRACPIALLREVAYNTFHERAPRILCNDPKDYRSYSRASLVRHYRYQYLAAVLVDRTIHADSRYATALCGVRASDPMGDELRGRVAQAWDVLDRVGKLMLQCQHSFSDRVEARTRLKSMFKSKAMQHDLRREVGADWWTCRLAGLLSVEEAQDFMLLWQCLHKNFTLVYLTSDHSMDLDALKGIGTSYYFDWKEHQVGRGSWTDWAVLAGGSRLFYSQWCQHERSITDVAGAGMNLSSPNNFVRDQLVALWRQRTQQQVAYERAVADSLVRRIRLMFRDVNNDRAVLASYLEVFMLFEQHFGSNRYPNTMAGVPFFASFPHRNPRIHR